MGELKCVVCGEPATTIRQGRDYCSSPVCHRRGPVPEVPITACEICGDPAVKNPKAAGRDVCARHLDLAA